MFSQLTRYASELGINIHKAELDVRAHYNQRGKLGINDVSPGCELLTYAWEIESDARPDRIQELLTQIDRGCHTLNSLRYPVPIEGHAELNGHALSFDQLPSAPLTERSAHPRTLIGS